MVWEGIGACFFMMTAIKLNTSLNSKATVGVINSPMRFFNINSTGRILNRFSQDLTRIDYLLPTTFYDCITMVLYVRSDLLYHETRINLLVCVHSCACNLRQLDLASYSCPLCCLHCRLATVLHKNRTRNQETRECSQIPSVQLLVRNNGGKDDIESCQYRQRTS